LALRFALVVASLAFLAATFHHSRSRADAAATGFNRKRRRIHHARLVPLRNEQSIKVHVRFEFDVREASGQVKLDVDEPRVVRAVLQPLQKIC
jgi:hypothetical protein